MSEKEILLWIVNTLTLKEKKTSKIRFKFLFCVSTNSKMVSSIASKTEHTLSSE